MTKRKWEADVSTGENMNSIWIDPKKLSSLRCIGQGMSGIIYQTTWKGYPYARKDFPGVDGDLFKAEVNGLLQLTHNNIVKCLGASIGHSCSLVLEYVNDNLHNFVQKKKFAGEKPPFKMLKAMDIMFQIASAIWYLHDKGVAHGDLKSNNVLLSNSTTNEVIDVKVVDFGLIKTKKRMRLVSKRTRYFEILRWKAPELVKKLLGSLTKNFDDPFLDYDTDSDSENSHDSDKSFETNEAVIKGDIYSFAMVCYEILTGDVPFSTTSSLSEVKEKVVDSNCDVPEIRVNLPSDCPSELKDLIETCWQREPIKRPSFAYIREKLKELLRDCSSLKPMEKVEPNPPASTASDSDISETYSSAVGVLPTKGKAMEKVEPNPPASTASDSDISETYSSAVGVLNYLDEEASSDSSVVTHRSTQERREENFDQIQGDSRFDYAGPSKLFREPSKYNIFLSYSGSHKNFAEQLCEDLERVHHSPFFDRRSQSFPKGEAFPALIIQAMRQCRLAVFVLSEEFFTRSKLPMIELAEIMRAQEYSITRLRILPLFFGISANQLKAWQHHWVEIWLKWAVVDNRIDVQQWMDALSKLSKINGMEYTETIGHVGFRKMVVKAICKLIPPNVKWDVSHIQSMERLCEPILQKMMGVKPSHEYGFRVVGLYGVGGIGKTTISKAICNHMFGEFAGKVCCVELGSMNPVQLQKTVLEELTEVNPLILGDLADKGKLAWLLKERMRRQRVLLILDNVWDHQIEEALMYLEAGYHNDSIALVTSRSLHILVQGLHIPRSDCLEMPELDEEGAINLFLHHTGRSPEMFLSENDRKTVKRCVEQCSFLKPEKLEYNFHYHPLALKILGTQLGMISRDVSTWEESLKKFLMADKFNILRNKIHPLFSILRQGFDGLRLEDKHIFLDLALLLVPRAEFNHNRIGQYFGQSDIWAWLCLIYEKTLQEIKESVNALWRNGLLEVVSGDADLEVKIHGLFLNFAEAEARSGPFERRRFLIDKDGIGVPLELRKHPSGHCWESLERLIIHNSKVRSLKYANLHYCSNVEVLYLRHCEELEELDVTGMGNLRYMEIIGCKNLGQRIEGIENLRNLMWLCWINNHHIQRDPTPKFISDPVPLPALQVLKPAGSQTRRFPNLPESLLKIDFSNSTNLVGSSPILSMTSLTNLQDLNLNCCGMVYELTGLDEVILLQKLNIGQTEISELPDLRKLERLQFLNVSSCRKLKSLLCITNAINLQHVDASRCESLSVLPDNFSSLKMLEVVDLSWDGLICILPNDYERLVEHNILIVEGCLGLVVPLVNELLRKMPGRSHAKCVDIIGCASMRPWINDARSENVNLAAYDLVKHIFPEKSRHWSYLLDDGERDEFLVTALFEHYDRGGTGRLTSAVTDAVTNVDHEMVQWWAVVATAPCTFGVVTERAVLEPWNRTLLHYATVRILPEFLVHGNPAKHGSAMEAVLRKCKEKLEEAIDKGKDLVLSNEGRKVVDTFLREVEAITSGRMKEIDKSSILSFVRDGGPSYSDFFQTSRLNETLQRKNLVGINLLVLVHMTILLKSKNEFLPPISTVGRYGNPNVTSFTFLNFWVTRHA